MKRILATAAIVAMSATAFAGGELDLRSEYTGTSFTHTGSTSQTGSNGAFGLNRGRVTFSGKTNENVSGKIQLNLASTGMVPGATAATSGLLHYAEVTNKWSDSMSLSAGKLDDTGMGGFEGNRSTGDMYFTSAAFMRNYFGGLRFAWTVSESNVLNIFALNQDFNNSTGGTTTATGTGYGLNYDGAMGDLGYTVSYHVLPMTVTAQPTATNTYINAGLSYKMSDWMFSFDYDMNTYGKQSVVTAGSDATKTSMVLMVDYNMGNWIPQLKYESSAVKDLALATAGSNDGATTNLYSSLVGAVPTLGAGAYNLNVTQFSIGTEYKSNPADKYRYHIMYVSKTHAFDGLATTGFTNKTTTATQVIAGFRWQADFLK